MVLRSFNGDLEQMHRQLNTMIEFDGCPCGYTGYNTVVLPVRGSDYTKIVLAAAREFAYQVPPETIMCYPDIFLEHIRTHLPPPRDIRGRPLLVRLMGEKHSRWHQDCYKEGHHDEAVSENWYGDALVEICATIIDKPTMLFEPVLEDDFRKAILRTALIALCGMMKRLGVMKDVRHMVFQAVRATRHRPDWISAKWLREPHLQPPTSAQAKIINQIRRCIVSDEPINIPDVMVHDDRRGRIASWIRDIRTVRFEKCPFGLVVARAGNMEMKSFAPNLKSLLRQCAGEFDYIADDPE